MCEQRDNWEPGKWSPFSTSSSPPWLLFSETERGHYFKKSCTLHHIAVSGICFLAGISKPQSRLVIWTVYLITLPSWWMILLNLFWVSRVHDPETWLGQAKTKELPGAPYPPTAYKLIGGNTAALIRGLLTAYTDRALPAAVTGHQGRLPSTIF